MQASLFGVKMKISKKCQSSAIVWACYVTGRYSMGPWILAGIYSVCACVCEDSN